MNKSIDRLGYYLVGFKKFYNKTMALIESHKSGYDLIWVFNDDVYGKLDWSVPVETNLLTLYKQRAEQLREKYDYLVMYYSGGADSTNALHAFIDNNIFIDELIMHMPEPVQKTVNGEDTSNLNYYSEVEYAAVAHLKKFKNSLNPNTKIKIQDFSKPGMELLNRDDWFESSPLGLSVSISGILRQVTQENDSHYLKIQDSGKNTCYIMGIDKPLVWNDGTNYYGFFIDTSAYHYINPVDFNKSSSVVDTVTTEFFYWTPDMPNIVIKQAQEIKKYYESNPAFKWMAFESLTKHITEYRDILHPIIYPDYTCEKFQTEKPSTHIMRPMDKWFWETASKKVQGNYLSTISYLESTTNPKHMIKNNIQFGIAGHKSKFYKL
jgi:hypothetical protein